VYVGGWVSGLVLPQGFPNGSPAHFARDCLIQIALDIALRLFQRPGRDEDIGGGGGCGRRLLWLGLEGVLQSGNLFFQTFDRLPQFRQFHIVLQIAGGKGVLNALGNL